MKLAREVDARGMNCPMPLLKAKQALNALASGDYIKVVATDAGSVRDFRVFAEQSGNSLVESSEADGVYTHILCKR